MSYGPFTAENYLSCASTPVSAVPLTLACWFNSTSATLPQALIAVPNTSTGGHRFVLYLRGDLAGDPVTADTIASSASSAASTSTGYSLNTWQSAAAVFSASNARAAYINGGSKGTNTGNRTPTSPSAIYLGQSLSNSLLPHVHLSGLLAEPAIWNVALTDAEVASHAKGVSPLLIRPQSLVFYAPLVRNLIDYRAALTITMTGTVAVDAHPRIYGL